MQQYKINELNKLLNLEQNEIIFDLNNNKIEQWVVIKKIWAKVENVTNNLVTNHDILENKNFYNVIIRNVKNIDLNMRFVYKNVILYIKHFDKLDKSFLKIQCEELA